MSRNEHHRDDPISRERLAQLGLAADRSSPEKSCPDADRFAEMLDAEAGSAVHRAFFEHISACEPCLQKWLVLSGELDSRSKDRTGATPWFKRRRLLTGVGSACGLALVAMLYLAIDYRPVQYDGADVQRAEKSSSGATIAEPDEQPQPEADSELVFEAAKTGQEAAPSAQIEEKSIKAASAPVPPVRMKEEKTSGGADSLEREDDAARSGYADQVVGGSMAMSKRTEVAKKERSSTAGSDPVFQPVKYDIFIESAADLCRSESDDFSVEAAALVMEQGRALLAPEALPTGERRIFVEEVVTFLEKEKAIDDKEWIDFCERVFMIMKPERNDSTP